MEWEVEYYEWNGKVYVKDFIDSLPTAKCKAKILRAIMLLEEFGPDIGKDYVKPITGYEGLWELREQSGRVAIRIFFSPVPYKKFLLLHGIVKKRLKIPPRELKIASERLSEYKQREIKIQKAQKLKA